MQKLWKISRWALLVVAAVLLMEFDRVQGHFVPGWHSERLNELVPKFGDALLIASFIALIVDIGSKKELLADLLFNSSAHIIGRQLPEEIREEVREYLNAQFVRPIWKISYQLTEYEKTGLVQLQSSYWGDLVNLTTKRQWFQFRVNIDPSWLAEAPTPRLLRVEVHKNQKNILKFPVSGLSFTENVKVKPGFAGRCETLLECVEYFPPSYEYSLINEATVQAAELTIYWDKTRFEVEVTLSSGSDDKVKLTSFDGYSVWNIDKPLLPGQCVLTRWKSRPKTDNTYQAKPTLGAERANAWS